MPKLRYVGVSIVMAVTSTFGNLMLLNTATGVMQSTGIGLTIGTYNILGYYHGNEGSKYGTARLKQIVTNINTMGYDVVGLQEYRDQKSGDAKAFEKALQSLNPAWKMSYTKSISDSDQLNFVYNSGTLQLIGDRVIKAAATDYGCDGGSQTVRIAEFTIIATGQRFMIINGHTNPHHGPSKCDAARLNVVKGALADAKVSAYTGPLYFVGDFNANPSGSRGNEKNIESYFKSVGWSNARDIPGAVRKDGGVIDHIYYKTSSTAAPTIYETLACKIISSSNPANYTAKTTCASDHYPVKAVFGGTGSSGANCGNLTEKQAIQFDAWTINLYDPSCVCSESSGTSTASMTGETSAEKAFNFLTSTNIATNGGKPLNAAQAAGMVGNLMVETGGGTYDLKTDAVNGIGAAGIVQWYKGRRTALNEFAKKQNTEWTVLKTQLEFIVAELESDYFNKTVMIGSKAGGKDINKGLINVVDLSAGNVETSVKIAANIIGRWYETPSISDRYPNRETAALQAYKDFAAGSTGSTASVSALSCSQGSQVTSGDFAATVKSFAWEDGRRGAEQKEAYTQALVGRYKGGNNGNDCGAFVSALMVKSGFETEYPGTSTSGQRAWLDANWNKIYSPGSVDVAQLQPGDVAIKPGHVFVWIGDVEGFAGKSAEAALGSNTAPTAILSSNTYSDPSLYTWFRKKAN